MRSIRVPFALVLSLALAGCINSTTLVKLKPDGSGTVEQTTLMNVAAMKGMMPGLDNGAGPNLMNQADLERTASRMGEGVRLVSSEPVKGAGGFEGVKAIFAFDDINRIQVSQDPGGSRSAEPAGEDPVKFALTRTGGASRLTISFTDKPGGGGAPSPDAGDMDLTNPMMMNMIKTMFQGFKITIGLEVVGDIIKTNAEYVNGRQITLLEMDMAALLADEAKFKALQGKLGPDASLSEVKPYLRDIKGIKIDGPTITVDFK